MPFLSNFSCKRRNNSFTRSSATEPDVVLISQTILNPLKAKGSSPLIVTSSKMLSLNCGSSRNSFIVSRNNCMAIFTSRESLTTKVPPEM